MSTWRNWKFHTLLMDLEATFEKNWKYSKNRLLNYSVCSYYPLDVSEVQKESQCDWSKLSNGDSGTRGQKFARGHIMQGLENHSPASGLILNMM